MVPVKELLPIEISKTRQLRQYKRIWSCVSQQCRRFPRYFGTLKFYKALLLASEFPTFYENFHRELEFLIFRINEINTT